MTIKEANYMTEYITDIKLINDSNLKYINIDGYKIFIYDV